MRFRSDLPLTRLGRIDQLDVDGAEPEDRDDGGVLTAHQGCVAGSRRTKTPFDVGVLLNSATLSNGTSTLVSG
jgi:hypothetical protein